MGLGGPLGNNCYVKVHLCELVYYVWTFECVTGNKNQPMHLWFWGVYENILLCSVQNYNALLVPSVAATNTMKHYTYCKSLVLTTNLIICEVGYYTYPDRLEYHYTRLHILGWYTGHVVLNHSPIYPDPSTLVCHYITFGIFKDV